MLVLSVVSVPADHIELTLRCMMTVASFGPFLLHTSIANAAAARSLSQIGARNRKGGAGGGGGLNDPKRFGRENLRGGAYTGKGALTVLYGIIHLLYSYFLILHILDILFLYK